MAGIDLLRWSQGEVEVKLHTSATDLLIATYSTLCRKEISATIILAHALDLSQAESNQLRALRHSRPQQGEIEDEPRHRDAPSRPASGRNFWLTLWSRVIPQAQRPELQLVVSCLSWTLGDYPIFLWSPESAGSTSDAELHRRIQIIQAALLDVVHPRRVFSIFGREDLVTAFRTTWTSKTGLAQEANPFYEAILTYCTKDTFKLSNRPTLDGRTRLASFQDLDSIAILCKEFADTSVYFPLTLEGGRQEAQWLIKGRVVWLYETAGRVVSICAATRQSDNVAVVTKVYTTPEWRRRGFAEALVRKVTEELLALKYIVALYVGIHNDAQHIYDRIGYVGLCGKVRPSDVEDVLEIGFRDTNRGHW